MPARKIRIPESEVYTPEFTVRALRIFPPQLVVREHLDRRPAQRAEPRRVVPPVQAHAPAVPARDGVPAPDERDLDIAVLAHDALRGESRVCRGHGAPQVPLEWQVKLTERLARLQQGLEMDPQRVAQEIAVFTDRCDVSEEIARFKSHLVQFRALYEESEPVGRRMDFLVQELNREVNTMGSKSNDADLTNSVVGMKSELEKIREQVQNIE